MIIPLLPEIRKILRESANIAICCHIDPDGDAIGSLLGLGLALTSQGLRVNMVSPDGVPPSFRFLPGADEVLTSLPPFKEPIVVVVLDCGDLDRLGSIAQQVSLQLNVINIDHHPTNTNFGTINWIEPEASATAEMVFFLLRCLAIPITEETATCLYTGIHTDTGGFRYQNTTARVHKVVGQLINTGVKPWRVSDRVYDTKPLSQIHLLQAALERLQVTSDGRIAWIALPYHVMSSYKEDDTSGIINYPRMVAGTELAILLKEDEKGQVKVGFRSREQVDVGLLAQSLGGGGHARAAGCVIPGPLVAAEKQVLTVAKRALKELEVDG
ncbi:MAG: DHH family phosphoesterase [bacterium]|jgi:phosphoesterase RecJ-like protein